MPNKDIIVATITFVKASKDNPEKTKKEIKQVMVTMGSLRAQGLHVIAVDGGSTPELIREMKSIGVDVHQQQGKGVGNALKEVLLLAGKEKPKAVLYMEGNKPQFAPYVRMSVDPILKGKADIVVPSRTRAVFRSQPKYQWMTEFPEDVIATIRLGRGKLQKGLYDVHYGPKAFTPAVIEKVVKDYRTSGGWDTHTAAVTRGGHAGFRVAKITVHAPYPKEELESDYLRRGGGLKPLKFRWLSQGAAWRASVGGHAKAPKKRK